MPKLKTPTGGAEAKPARQGQSQAGSETSAPTETEPMAAKRYYARQAFTYAGISLDPGQVFELKGMPKDEQLLRLGYIQPLKAGDPLAECGACNQRFRGDNHRDMHGRLRHSGLDGDDFYNAMEMVQDRAAQAMPLALENTVASRA